MLDAAEKALSFSAGMTREAFAADPKTVFATIRALEVVGEAAKNVLDAFRTQHASVPWGDMAGMRDVLIHDYFGVDLTIVWETLRSDLPALVRELRRILAG
jgi:uncharacterized protein with HEPN domain